MSKIQELKISERDTTITPHQLRTAGFVPATCYGKDLEPKAVQVRAHEFQQLFVQGVREFKLTGFVSGRAKAQGVHFDPVAQTPVSLQLHVLNN